MAETKKDNNKVGVIMGVLNTDGSTPTAPTADPSTHALRTNDGTSGSDLGNDIATRDNSGNPTMIATDASGNIIPLYVNSTGSLMIKST